MNKSHKGTTVHEIYPRSQRPKTWNTPENKVLLCNDCHDRIHREGASKWVYTLLKLQKDWENKYETHRD